jgi:hypothetical protein
LACFATINASGRSFVGIFADFPLPALLRCGPEKILQSLEMIASE